MLHDRYCPKCKDFRQARKKFELWQMPQTLVIHLKRFQYTRFSRDKIITFCDFPLTGTHRTRTRSHNHRTHDRTRH